MSIMADGVIVIDKPKGVTSSYVDRVCKRIFAATKVGHVGTLDPFATGVLLVAIGSGTKTIRYINCPSKTYEFEIKFGEKTNTGDCTGHVIESSNHIPDPSKIQEILPRFIGELQQKPHIFSAVKVNGKRAYKIARNGGIPDIKSRKITVFSLDLIGESSFRATVSQGTYIRTLAEDIAVAAGTCGHVTSLRRTVDGKFSLNHSIKLDALPESSDNLWDLIVPIRDVLDDIPVVSVSVQDSQSLMFGRYVEYEAHLADGTYLLEASDGFLGVVSAENGVLHLEKLFYKGGI
jgi:tRNA pseudouridine55 synthase